MLLKLKNNKIHWFIGKWQVYRCKRGNKHKFKTHSTVIRMYSARQQKSHIFKIGPNYAKQMFKATDCKVKKKQSSWIKDYKELPETISSLQTWAWHGQIRSKRGIIPASQCQWQRRRLAQMPWRCIFSRQRGVRPSTACCWSYYTQQKDDKQRGRSKSAPRAHTE